MLGGKMRHIRYISSIKCWIFAARCSGQAFTSMFYMRTTRGILSQVKNLLSLERSRYIDMRNVRHDFLRDMIREGKIALKRFH